MAESKKPSGKAKNTHRKYTSSTPKHKVIDGVVVDESVVADPSAPEKNFGSSADTTVKKSGNGTPQNGSKDNGKQSPALLSHASIMVVSVIAVTMALLSLAVSFLVYWQMADLNDVDRSSTLQSGAVMSDGNRIDFDNINDRLNQLKALIAENAQKNAILRQDIASVPVHDNISVQQPDDVLDTSIMDNVISRIVALEAGSADQNKATPTISKMPPVEVAVNFNQDQIGLLAAAGLLVENLAGRQLSMWVNVLDGAQWPGVAAEDRDIIRAAGEAPIESRANLLSLGRFQLTSMSQGLSKVESGSGLLDHARAQLADLVKLKRVGSGADQPTTLLAAFEVALDHADFDAALAAANVWSSAGLTGLESWLVEARRRQDLDAAVNRVVAIFVRQANGKN